MRSAVSIFPILATSAVVIALVGPFGDFPLSDDWSYAHAVRSMCVGGPLDLLPWTGASVIAQAGYGAVLCRVFGFSYDVLRASTLVLAVVGTLLLNRLLSHLRIGAPARGLVLATVGLSPLYVGMAFTFMTDLPFTVCVLASVYCYSRALDDRGKGMTAAGAALGAISVLIRQHGLVVIATAALAFLLARDRALGRRARDAIVACGVPLAMFAAYNVWLIAEQGVPPALTNKVTEASALSLSGTANIAFRAVETLGLALLPLSLLSLPRVWRERRGVFLILSVVLGALGTFLYAREGALMFYLPNVQYDFGVGALTLRDVLFLDEAPPFALGTPFRVFVTLAATLGAAAGLAALPDRHAFAVQPSRRFIFLTGCGLLASSFLHTAFYLDRYLLPILPLAAVVLALAAAREPVDGASRAAVTRRWLPPICWLVAAMLAFYAIAGTHDYMAWNRARYEMLDELEAEGVGPERIDGGMEYNGWRLAAKLGTWPTRADVVPGTRGGDKSWWWVVDDEYLVAFRPQPGYSVRGRRGYDAWLGGGEAAVLMLQRAPTSAGVQEP